MTFLESSSYAVENACHTQTTTLSRVDELLSETLFEDIARILSDRTLNCSMFTQCRKNDLIPKKQSAKKAIAEKSNCGKLKLGGVP